MSSLRRCGVGVIADSRGGLAETIFAFRNPTFRYALGSFCIQFKSRSPTKKKILHRPVTYETLIHVHFLVEVFSAVSSQLLFPNT